VPISNRGEGPETQIGCFNLRGETVGSDQRTDPPANSSTGHRAIGASAGPWLSGPCHLIIEDGRALRRAVVG
jgi:hypothetical protein